MPNGEPLEDDDWYIEGQPQSLKLRLLVVGEIILLVAGTTVGLWFATRDAVVLIVSPLVAVLLVPFMWSAMGGGRAKRWLESVRKGEYAGPWRFGPRVEEAVQRRRARILEERRQRGSSDESGSDT